MGDNPLAKAHGLSPHTGGKTMVLHIQYFSGSNTDGSFTTADLNSFLSPLGKIS